MKELILKTLLEGLGLGALLVLVCAVGMAVIAAALSAIMLLFIH